MVSNESRPQGTSISETWGRPVTAADVEDMLDKEGIPRGSAARIMQAVRQAISWEKTKLVRPWGDLAEGGLTRADQQRTDERRKRIAERLLEEAAAKKAAREAEPEQDAEVIELPVVPGQTIADVVAEFTREEPEPEPEPEEVPVPQPVPAPEPQAVLPAPEPVPAAPEEPPAPATPEPAPEPAAALPEPSVLTCKSCRLELPAEAFGRDRHQPTGRMKICRPCRSKIRLEQRARVKAAAEAALAERRSEAAREARRAARALADQLAQQRAAAVLKAAQRAAAASAAAVPALPVGHKRCNACGEVKPHADFQKNAGVKDGRRGRCKECETRQHRSEGARLEAYRTAVPPGTLKECRRCGQMRRVPDDFYQRTGRKISNTCITCERELARNRRST